MKNKKDRVIDLTAFHLENRAITLQIRLENYDATNKFVTAVFSPTKVETGQLKVIDNIINIPILASMVDVGINEIQLNFREGTQLEQSGKLIWNVKESIEAREVAQEKIDIITDLINRVTETIDSVQDILDAKANKDDLNNLGEKIDEIEDTVMHVSIVKSAVPPEQSLYWLDLSEE